jgi:hypothetical protein
VAGVRRDRRVGDVKAFEVGSEGFEVEIEPQVATNAIEGGGVQR